MTIPFLGTPADSIGGNYETGALLKDTEREGLMAVEPRDFSVYPGWILGAVTHEYLKIKGA